MFQLPQKDCVSLQIEKTLYQSSCPLDSANRWILRRLSTGKALQSGEYRTSTIYSALKRLQKDGYVIYSNSYEMEDPFFREWILDSDESQFA